MNHTRIQQQEIITELSQQALKTDDFDKLLHSASAAVTQALDTEYCGMLKRHPDKDTGILRQGAGWRSGVIGATVLAVRDSLVGYTLRTEEPVIVDDLRTDTRFSGSTLLTDHGVRSGISVIIGSSDDPWGVLGAYATEQREFTKSDADFIRRVANVLTLVLERSKREPEQMQNRISDGFVTLDEKWRFTYLNDHANELFNLDGRPLVGKRVWEEFPAALSRTLKPKAEHALSEQVSVSYEEYYPAPLDVWFEVRVYPSETGLSVYFRDITERRERKQELERVERRFDAIFEDPNILIGFLEPDGTVRNINGAAMEYVDVAREDVTGDPFWETPWWEESNGDQSAVREWIKQAAAGEHVEFDVDLRRPDGQRYTLDGVFKPITNDKGEVISISVSGHDITDRKEYERRLNESEQRYRTLIESFPNGTVALVDENLQYVTFGGTPLGDADLTRADLEGALVRDTMPSKLEEVIIPHYTAALDGETSTFKRMVGDRFYQFHFVPVCNEDGDVFAAMGMSQDITTQKERERKLEQSNKRLERFAYAASHDLQEPLRMVISYLRLLENHHGDGLDEESQEYLEFAVDGAERMRKMIDGLLKYSRVETQGDPFEPIHLNAVLEDALADLQLRISETEAEVTTDELPSVDGDANQLRQVFQNLLSNAITYSGNNPPDVHIGTDRQEEEWVISVTDEGIGIDPDNHERVFTIFDRLHSREEYEGSGIGLALCERIIERHGGEIWVDSKPGEGSTFSFTLPVSSEQ